MEKKNYGGICMGVEIFIVCEDFEELYMYLLIVEGGVYERIMKKKILFIGCLDVEELCLV